LTLYNIRIRFLSEIALMEDSDMESKIPPTTAAPVAIRPTAALVVLTVSWVVFAAAGYGLFLYASLGQPGVAVRASIAFAIYMLFVHWVGYMFYTRQEDDSLWSAASEPPAYRGALKWALLQQAVVFAPLLILLDGEFAASVAAAVTLGYWLVTLIIVRRRPTSPTPGDIAFVKYGFVAIFLAVFLWTCLWLPYRRHGRLQTAPFIVGMVQMVLYDILKR
jgi:hypothetical protein